MHKRNKHLKQQQQKKKQVLTQQIRMNPLHDCGEIVLGWSYRGYDVFDLLQPV